MLLHVDGPVVGNEIDERSGSFASSPSRSDRPGDGHLCCPHCGYDLTGAPTNRCPECGNEVGDHVYCLHCDYDLTGTPTNRCPECGNEFDRAALVDWYYKDNQPLPADGFLGLARMSLLQPVRLGRGMPPSPRLNAATRYAVKVRSLTGCVLLLGVLVAARNAEGLLISLLAAVVTALCSQVCEVLLAVIFTSLVRGREAYARLDYRYWRTMTACFSTYLLVTCTLVMANAWLRLPFIGRIGGFLLPLVMGWWWYGLGRAMAARTEPSAGRAVALLLIPVVGVAAAVLGFFLGFVTVLGCAQVFRF